MAKTLGQQQAEYGITAQNPYGLAASSPYAPSANSGVQNLSGLTPNQSLLTTSRPARDALQTQGADFSGWQKQLQDLLSNPSSIQNDPSYQFRLGQGQQAIERSNAAKGMLGSGNVLAELAKYGQGMASEELGNKTNTLAALMGGAQKFGVATDYFKTPTYGQPAQSSSTSWNMAYGQPVSNTYNW